MRSLPGPLGVYAILDAGVIDPGLLPETAAAMARSGVDVFQVRAKSVGAGVLAELVTSVRAALPTEAVLIVNDRADVALATGSDGVHVGDTDLPVDAARKLLPSGSIVGRSTHSVDEIRWASRLECDYVGFGPVFETSTKDTGHEPHGIEGLREACAASRRPVVAIGGIGIGEVRAVRDAGASGVAMISALLVPGRAGDLAAMAVEEFGGR